MADLQASGIVRLAASGRMVNLGSQSREELSQVLPIAGEVWVIIDRVRGGDALGRTTESLENAFAGGEGEVVLFVEPSSDPQIAEAIQRLGPRPDTELIDGQPWHIVLLSKQLRCLNCGIDYPDPEPAVFSFNSPLGACPLCEGFGDTIDLDMNLVVPDASKTLREGAIAPWNTPSAKPVFDDMISSANRIGLRLDVPYSRLTEKERNAIIDGVPSQNFGGLKGFFEYLERKKYKMHVRVFLSRWRSYSRCPQCNGRRLHPKSLAFRIGGINLAEFCEMEIDASERFLQSLIDGNETEKGGKEKELKKSLMKKRLH